MGKTLEMRVSSALIAFLLVGFVSAAEPLRVGDRAELFVDDHLVQGMTGLTRVLHQPQDIDANPPRAPVSRHLFETFGLAIIIKTSLLEKTFAGGARRPSDSAPPSPVQNSFNQRDLVRLYLVF